MAVVNYTMIRTPADTLEVAWVLSAGDTGSPLAWPQFADKTVQVYGTFNSETVALKGTNDDADTNYMTMDGTDGVALSFTSAGMKAVAQNPLRIRPEVTGTTGVTVTIKVTVPNRRL